MPQGARAESGVIARKVIEILEPELVADGFDLLDVRVFQGGGRYQLRIYVDLAEGGIDMGQCTRASRTVGMLLEEADLFAGQYVIEVSSPGVRRPLRKLEHYQAAVGQQVDLKLQRSGRVGNSGAGPRRLRGTLQAVEGSELVIETVSEGAVAGETPDDPGAPDTPDTPVARNESSVQRVSLDRVREGNLDPEFDAQALINADRRRRREEKRTQRREKRGQGRKSRPRKK